MGILAYGLSYFELGSIDPKADQNIVLNNAVYMAQQNQSTAVIIHLRNRRMSSKFKGTREKYNADLLKELWPERQSSFYTVLGVKEWIVSVQKFDSIQHLNNTIN